MAKTLNGEIIQIHVGQAGVQIANACWELYCIEHGINSNGCLCQIPKDDSYKTFFALSQSMKVVPRLVLVDSEPTVIDEIRTGWYRNLFHPDSLINGKDDCGSNFARGYHTIGMELIDFTMDRIRKLAEVCDNLRGFLMFRAIGGGTGSGFGNLLFEQFQMDFGKMPKMEYIVFPSPSMAPLIIESYNALLSTHLGMDISDCSFIMDNEALYDICTRKLDVKSPTYTNINRIIAQVVSSFTAPQRFYGSSNISFGEFQTNLVPYPRIHFPLVSYAPLSCLAKSCYDENSINQLTLQCFDPSNHLVRCSPAQGKYMACVLLYRGDISTGDINASMRTLDSITSGRFVEWSPTGFKTATNSMPPSFVQGGDLAATNRAVTALTNNTAIEKAWCRLIIKFNKLFKRRAFIHHFLTEGMEESSLTEASENICSLIRDYQEVNKL
ncbi:tubulin alpha-3 chain-like isoform X1 [Episyrphus balteatus]|uniref:tubulin alpha-3 chain-like isoform X1 n=1 Tax=Episyrphus balteatus TaxID=286459 RepID=UPI00248609C3|nr:tubulin alpha-3 chain-like isoform X1 [Episyrphus balteatus]